MVIAKSNDSDITGRSHRYLDVDKINKSLDKVTSNGASYAEVRLVAYTDYSVAMRDGKLERLSQGKKLVLRLESLLMVHGAFILRQILLLLNNR